MEEFREGEGERVREREEREEKEREREREEKEREERDEKERERQRVLEREKGLEIEREMEREREREKEREKERVIGEGFLEAFMKVVKSGVVLGSFWGVGDDKVLAEHLFLISLKCGFLEEVLLGLFIYICIFLMCIIYYLSCFVFD